MRPFRLSPAAIAIALFAAAAPGEAQYIGAAPPPPGAPLPGTVETPAGRLARSVRVLAGSPMDFNALMSAGRAELDLGDLEAAIAFFGRADEVRPSDPGPKIGIGAASAQSGDARGALAWFGQAQSLGASAALMGADRGLAHDLLGELAAAQADYRAALLGANRDEARRRLSLSLAIGGKASEALAVLQPLLERRDPAAQRVRAFVLALGGDQAQASRAIDQAMPGSAARVAPFFALLPRLSTQQKAAAVHLGVFPKAGEVRLAEAMPAPTPVRRAPTLAVPKTVTRNSNAGKATLRYEPIKPPPETVSPTIAPGPAAAPPPSPPPQQQPARVASVLPVASTGPGFSSSVLPGSGDRLSGIDRILAGSAEDRATPAPADRPDADKARESPGRAATDPRPAAQSKAAAAKRAADKKAAEKKAAEDKQAADDRKAKQDAARIGAPGTHWVQLAGGSNQDRMGSQYKRIKAKKPALFAGHPGYVTAGKDYFRLLVGPFDSADDARAYVNKLANAGIDGFSWTRTPAQIKIEKLPVK